MGDTQKEALVEVVNPISNEVVKIPSAKLKEAVEQDGFRLPQPKVAVEPPVDPSAKDNVLAINPLSKEVVSMPRKNFAAAQADGFLPAPSTEYQKQVQAEKEKLGNFQIAGKGLGSLFDSSKQYDVEDGKGNFKLVGPNNELIQVPMKDVTWALNNGFRFQDQNFQALIDANKLTHGKPFQEGVAPTAKDAMTELRYSLEGGAEGLAFGLPSSIRDFFIKHPTNEEDRASQIVHKLMAETTFSKTYNAAQPIGAITGILATGGAGVLNEGAWGARAATATTKALGGGALGKIAGGMVEGAILSSPQAAVQGILKGDEKAAAETLALGVGIGGAFGIGRVGLGKVAEKMTLESANQSLLKQTGATTAELRSIENKLGSNEVVTALEDAGVFKNAAGRTASKQEIAENIQKLLSDNGELIGKLNKTAEGVTEKNPHLGFDFTKVAIGLENAAQKLTGSVRASERKVFEDAAKYLNELGEGKPMLSPKEAQEAKQFFQNDVAPKAWAQNMGTGNLNEARKAVAAAVREEQEAMFERVVKELDNPKMLEDYLKAKNLYRIGKELEDASNRFLAAPLDKSFKDMLSTSLFSFGTGAKVGAAIGFGVGGSTGAAVGKFAGDYIDKFINNYAKDQGITKLSSWIRKNRLNPNLPSFLALDAHTALKARLDEKIKGTMEQIAVSGAKTAPNMTHQDAIKNILGPEANGLSKQQQFNKFSEYVTRMMGDPALAQSQAKDYANVFRNDHPDIADALEENMMKKMQYIYDILPKATAGNAPFRKNEEFKPSAAQLEEFQKNLQVAQDPFYVMDLLKAGRLTQQQVATLSVLNPEILGKMREELAKMAYSGKIELTHQQRLSASLLMGEAMSKDLTAIPALQSVYGPTQQSSAPVPKQAGKGGSKITGSSTQPTGYQRLMGSQMGKK